MESIQNFDWQFILVCIFCYRRGYSLDDKNEKQTGYKKREKQGQFAAQNSIQQLCKQ